MKIIIIKKPLVENYDKSILEWFRFLKNRLLKKHGSGWSLINFKNLT